MTDLREVRMLKLISLTQSMISLAVRGTSSRWVELTCTITMSQQPGH